MFLFQGMVAGGGNVLAVDCRVVMTILVKTWFVTKAWKTAGVFTSIGRERAKGEIRTFPEAWPVATSTGATALKLKVLICD